ncbi:maleylpyruvate isomerase family mycothiol-dependent enzyme [Kribbella sp. DT2]|uniref:maleylpyruvate isomerase family mycothiol-dependent enzyme n=1 Tax=Kribbella sp. DT2 TaxID=3393427 RepID=UPI003CED4D81
MKYFEPEIHEAAGGAAMDTSAYLIAVVEQTSTFADWVNGQDAKTPVPTCPEWTLAELVDHVGATQRMVALIVGERLTEPSKAFEAYVPAPADSAEWGAWLNGTAAEAKAAYESATDDTPAWDPNGGIAGAPYWARRLFGEACVHRADAAATLGTSYELAPEHAAAAVEDWLETMTSATYWASKPQYAEAMRGDGQTLHLHTTDADGEWVARREPDRIVLERTHAKADVAVRGPAVDLLLVISRRRRLEDAPALEVHGDRALFEHWVEQMNWTTGA